jgi:hypothetical protein
MGMGEKPACLSPGASGIPDSLMPLDTEDNEG